MVTATNMYTSCSPITTKTHSNKRTIFRHVKFAVPIQKRTKLSISAAGTTAIQVDGPTASSKASKTLPFRVGHGFDLHRLEPGYPLIIGGIDVPHDRGCEAHSDGDVLLHCVVDAVLGALGLPDIGQILPDSDPKSKGAPSSVFIKEAPYQAGETCARGRLRDWILGCYLDPSKAEAQPTQGGYQGKFIGASRSRPLCCKSESEIMKRSIALVKIEVSQLTVVLLIKK